MTEAPHIFTPEYYERLARFEQHHPWSAYMQRLTFTLLDGHTRGAPVRILDAGCGAGHFTHRWKEHSRIRVSIGLDSSLDGLRICGRSGKAPPVAGSVAALPFRGESFDAIHCADVMQHLTPPDASHTVEEFLRVLRPGGVLVIRTAARRGIGAKKHSDTDDYQQWEPEKLRSHLESRGFRVEWLSLVNWLPSLAADLRAYRRPAPSGDVGLHAALVPVEGLHRVLLEAYWSLEQVLLLRLGARLPLGHTLLCLARKP